MKKTKKGLKCDSVSSDSFHVGIELELRAPCEVSDDHDDEGCQNSRYESQLEYLSTMGAESLLREYCDLDRDTARRVADYFNEESFIRDYMSNWDDGGCDDDDCRFKIGGGEDTRDAIRKNLKALTGNASIKVVEDSSIKIDSGQTDAEVCWNYFASKDTIADNAKILKYLKDAECSFDSSCGLHINLNNYLKLDTPEKVPTEKLEFLFKFVGASRKSSSYCRQYGISSDDKYSMLYNQSDRIEFRFFSPTLEAKKLHHYVVLANTVYKRLAGKNAKLPKKTMTYFLDKMTAVNGVSASDAMHAIKAVNSLMSYEQMITPARAYTAQELPF